MPPRDDEVQALVEQLSAELDRSVLVDDASLRLLAYSPTLGSEDEVRRTAILTRETPRVIRDLHFAQGIATATQPVRTAPRPDIGLESRVCVPIRCQGALFGYLWLIDADQSLTEQRLRGRRAHARPRSAPRCTAATNSRSRSGSSRCGCSRRCSATTPAQREVAAHELAVGELLRRRAPAVGVLTVRRSGETATPSSGRRSARGSAWRSTSSAARCRAGRRSAPSTATTACSSRCSPSAAASPTWRAARRTRSTRRSPATATRVIGYSEPASTCATPTAPTSTPGWRCASSVALPEHGSPAGWEDLGAYRLLARAAETPHAQRADPSRPAEAVRAAHQGIARADARGLPRQRLRHQAHGRGAVPAPGAPVLPAAAHRGDHRRPASRAARTGSRCIPGSSSPAWSACIRR